MRRFLRWLGYILAGLGVLIVLLVGFIFLESQRRFNRNYEIAAETVTVPTDKASVERGEYLYTSVFACVDCHEADRGGKLFFDAPPIARLTGANLTTGAGGVGGQRKTEDYVRAIRHGVGPDKKPLLVMPSKDYSAMSDADIAALIAFIKSAPPVDRQPVKDVQLVGRALFVFNQLPALDAEHIDHAAQRAPAPAPGVTIEYGRYLAKTAGCQGCHNDSLSGGKIATGDPSWPPAANLTPTGIGKWSDEDFFKAMRTGKRPDGSDINTVMPWQTYAKLRDDDLKAILLYLRQLPPKATGVK